MRVRTFTNITSQARPGEVLFLSPCYNPGMDETLQLYLQRWQAVREIEQQEMAERWKGSHDAELEKRAENMGE